MTAAEAEVTSSVKCKFLLDGMQILQKMQTAEFNYLLRLEAPQVIQRQLNVDCSQTDEIMRHVAPKCRTVSK
jgi:hypothetical protein